MWVNGAHSFGVGGRLTYPHCSYCGKHCFKIQGIFLGVPDNFLYRDGIWVNYDEYSRRIRGMRTHAKIQTES